MATQSNNWLTNIQVRDLDDNQRLECTCKRCGHVHYLTKADLIDRDQDYLDEIEGAETCKARHCGGPVRLAYVRTDELSGFVGGMA